VIAVEALTHSYDRARVVLDHVSFEVRAGSVTGLVGPNGAGKTTLMRTIATLLRPRGGRVTVGGHDVARDPARARRTLGFVPERATPYLDLMCWEHLDFFARATAVPAGERAARVKRALEQAGLQDRAEASIKELSKGLRQRLALQAALIHGPDALVLDEPTDGLDPESRGEVLTSIRALADAGRAVLISSHVLSEIEEVSDDVVILVDGKRHDVAPDAPRAPVVRVRVRERSDEAERLLAGLPAVAAVTREPDALQVTLAIGASDAGDVAAALVRGGFTLTALEPIQTTLASTFREVIARSRDPRRGAGGGPS
jgi:ABC-2 type transport system ATP-binding protein